MSGQTLDILGGVLSYIKVFLSVERKPGNPGFPDKQTPLFVPCVR